MNQLTPEDASWPELHRVRRAIVVVDVVESVRLMQADEAGTIDRWRRFVREVRTDVLPKFGGRMVKSLGDGMLLEFAAATAAVAAVGDIRSKTETLSGPDSERLSLRCGAHVADVLEDADDIYGSGVNIAARIAALARPGGFVVSSALHDEVLEGWDGVFKDLGPCYFKHLSDPIRCYEVLPPRRVKLPDAPRTDRLRPVVAIMPVRMLSALPGTEVAGAIVADRLIAGLSRDNTWYVLSRLTALALRDRSIDTGRAAQLLAADYLLVGAGTVSGSQLELSLELKDTRSGDLLWTDRFWCSLDDLVAEDSCAIARVGAAVAHAVLGRELVGARGLPMDSLPGYSLLLAAVQHMHRLSSIDRSNSRAALGHLVERHPRSVDAHAWLAKWHFLRIAQVDGDAVSQEVSRARSHLDHALDLQPDHGMSLALRSHLLSFVDADLAGAETGLREAVTRDGGEPLGWLFLSHALAVRGNGPAAVQAIQHTERLSPLDPLRYFMEMFAATAYIADNQFVLAVQHAERSVELNALHLPGLAVLIVAQQLAGQAGAARESARRYLALRPRASVDRFLANHCAPDSAMAQCSARAMLEAGLPH